MDGKCPLAGCTARPWFSVERAPNSKPEKVKTYDLFWCGKCQHGFISPTPSWDLLNDYYDSYHLNSAGSQGQGRPRGLMDRAIQHIAWRLNWGTPFWLRLGIG